MGSIASIIIAAIVFFAIVQLTLLFLLPFFVFKIRNTVLTMSEDLENINKNIYAITTTLQKAVKTNHTSNLGAEQNKPMDQVKHKICKHCGGKNRKEDFTCTHCSQPLV
jgi:hypothetical protein